MTWLWIALTIVGAIAFSALVWFAGPLIFIADVQPLGSDWLRLAIVAVVLLAVALYVGIVLWRRRKAAAALEKGIAEAAPEDSDATVLAEKLHDALATLKGTSKSKSGYLYELPWYLIIGPPGRARPRRSSIPASSFRSPKAMRRRSRASAARAIATGGSPTRRS